MVVSVSKTPCNINWAGVVDDELSMKNFKSLSNPNICGTMRQNFAETYILNGGIYFGKWDVFYNKLDYYEQDTYAYIMPKERSVDVDCYADLDFLKFILKEKLNE